MAQQQDLTKIIYTPPQAARLTVEMVEQLGSTANLGLKSGIPDLDKFLVPMRPTNLITVQGYTGWYKTGLMDFIAKSAVPQIHPEDDEIILKVTWELSVEEETIRWMSSRTNISVTQLAQGILNPDEWTVVRKAANERINTPIWIMGHSQMEFSRAGAVRPRMTMGDVANACEMMAGGKITGSKHKIRMIVLDYLQRMAPDRAAGSSRREQQMHSTDMAKDLAISFGCPVLLGVQSGRQVMERDNKLPQLDDAQETSNIEQSSQVVLSVWYPIKTEKPDPTGKKPFEIDGHPIDENLLIIGLMKQTFGPAPKTLAVRIDPARNTIAGWGDEWGRPNSRVDNRKVYRGEKE